MYCMIVFSCIFYLSLGLWQPPHFAVLQLIPSAKAYQLMPGFPLTLSHWAYLGLSPPFFTLGLGLLPTPSPTPFPA